jgi:epoxyqueuosine reductase
VSAVLDSRELRALSTQAGFDLCGFARCEPIPPSTLVHWLEAGMAADMDWMAERVAERLDVTRLLPGARTVISFACNYWHPDPPGAATPVARYARGRDYHYTMQDRLRAFRRGLKERHPEVETFATVDTGPVMEKVWAARAGVGYVGKNGCLYTRPFGSWVVLATLAMDAEVEAGAYASGPAEDLCGSCTLCLSACPTEAITPDRQVDAALCLSYQTIENRDGPVPERLRGAMADVAFGCDICQEVCPLNQHPLAAGERFLPRAVASLSAADIAALGPEDYRRLVPGTALARARYDGLRRNAAYALGAAREARARPVLERLATDPAPLVREAAMWALARLHD